jgi:hypothetical protein
LFFASEQTVWSNNGYDNLNNLHSAIQKHKKSKSHISSLLQFKTFGTSRIDIQLDSQLRAGRPVKGATAGVNSSAPLPKKGASKEGKGGRDEKASRGTSPVFKSPRGEKDVTVGTTADGHLGDHPPAPKNPSGTLKPTAKDTSSAPVPAVSKEAASRRTSPGAPGDVSGPLNVAPVGTTSTTAQVDKVVPTGELRNKTPVQVSGVKNTRKFLDWIRANSESKLVVQMKGEILMLVPETADGFWATIGALRSLDVSEGVSFHAFSLPEDRCVRLLLKNLGKCMPEAEIREEIEALHINMQAVMQLRSKRRDQDPEKDRPMTPHFIVSVARGPDVAKVRSVTDLCGLRLRVETYNAPKGLLQCKHCQRFGHTQRNCDYAPKCVACDGEHPSGKCVTPKQQLKCCRCGGNHTANYRGCSKWKEAKAATAKRAQGERSRKDGVSTRLPAPKSAPA